MALKARTSNALSEHHKILGHACEDRVRSILIGLGIPFSDDGSLDCPDCPAGKGKRATHPRQEDQVDSPGVVHVDLLGIANKDSLQNFRY